MTDRARRLEDLRISGTIGAADMSALATGPDARNEERAARMTVPPNSLRRLLQHEILSAAPRRLGDDLQAMPYILVIDQVAGDIARLRLAVLGFLRGEAGALLTAPVLALAADLLQSEVGLA
jgi:hypothetical protein